MSRIVIVPDYVRDAINAKLDAAIEARPDAAAFRDELYQQLLEHFDATGDVPDFTIGL